MSCEDVPSSKSIWRNHAYRLYTICYNNESKPYTVSMKVINWSS